MGVVPAMSVAELGLSYWLKPCSDLMTWLTCDSVLALLAATALFGMCSSLVPVYAQLRENPGGGMEQLQKAFEASSKEAAELLNIDASSLKRGIVCTYATLFLFLIGALWA